MFRDAPWHFGTPHAGRTYEWLSTDTEENFQQLMQDPGLGNISAAKGGTSLVQSPTK